MRLQADEGGADPAILDLLLERAGDQALIPPILQLSDDETVIGIDGGTMMARTFVEHLAGVEDFDVAMATYRPAYQRWPGRSPFGKGAGH